MGKVNIEKRRETKGKGKPKEDRKEEKLIAGRKEREGKSDYREGKGNRREREGRGKCERGAGVNGGEEREMGGNRWIGVEEREAKGYGRQRHGGREVDGRRRGERKK